ncbi:hypothetical protein [Methanoculleus sp.]|jgi:hypothetical protein|uniref:hypothetical protein n=1 Tax=Methanoculleus sp. TaxID=90427 RepID=UPI0025CBB1E0|nr:hypothetical protein [Methanoculleus sp.]MCK9319693.1 hypothetical protein [Methanoculleus sp.]
METLILTLAFSTLIAILYFVVKRFVEKMLLSEQLLYVDTYLVHYPIFENTEVICLKYQAALQNTLDRYEENETFFRFEVYAKLLIDLLYKFCIYYNYKNDKINKIINFKRVGKILGILNCIDKSSYISLLNFYDKQFNNFLNTNCIKKDLIF